MMPTAFTVSTQLLAPTHSSMRGFLRAHDVAELRRGRKLAVGPRYEQVTQTDHCIEDCIEEVPASQLSTCSISFFRIGRGERIRTSGPCLPKTVLYQAELLPDRAPGRAIGWSVRCRAQAS